MNKTIILLAAMVLVVGLGSYFVFAQDRMDTTNGNNDMMQNRRMNQQRSQDMMGQGMMDENMMGMCPCPMHMMMVTSMMGKQMTVTEGGEVVVLAGNMIMKFDEQLDLVKEAELIDMEQLQQKMQKMMESCPMQQKMQNDKMGNDQDSQYEDQENSNFQMN